MSVEIKPLLADDFPALVDLYPWPDSIWIRANFVQSLNGKVTDTSGALYLASEKDKLLFSYLRATADCILIGRETATSQPYKNVKIAKKYSDLRHSKAPLQIAILSNTLDFPAGFFEDFKHKPLLISSQAAIKNHQEILPWVEPIALGESSVDLPQLKNMLKERGLLRVVCEGGPGLATELVNLDLIDEINLTVSKQIKSTNEKSLFTQSLALERGDAFHFKQILYDSENLFLRILKK